MPLSKRAGLGTPSPALEEREREESAREPASAHRFTCLGQKSSRSESLLDSYSKKQKSSKHGKDGKEEPTGWDRDRDMAVGGRLMDDGQRRAMIKDAKGLGGRFGTSGFL
ncbi:hypothetical protein JCM10212_005228 [Sporobolomyces blumeae]